MKESCANRCARVWMESELRRKARREAMEAAGEARRTTSRH